MTDFNDMDRWSLSRCRKYRKQLLDELAKEIQKRNSIKAEIIWLEKEIEKYRGDNA